MATRTVRLDDEAEAALREVRESTGMATSAALKEGLRALRDRVRHRASRVAYDVYKDLSLGPGGYAIAASTDVRRGVQQALAKKLRRSR